MITLDLLMKTSRNAVIKINDGGFFNTKEKYKVFLNGCFLKSTNQVITSLDKLIPDTDYLVSIQIEEKELIELEFKTEDEIATLNVKDFGAKGNGNTDDTLFIQAAIMACPKDGRVLIPKGKYKIVSLFLKSNINIELEKDACLQAETDRRKFPIYPGLIENYHETKEYNLGTWEGNPLPMFTGIITGVEVENVKIYGEGTIDGHASNENWWFEEKKMRGAFRPRMIFLERCNNIVVQGILLKNSPAWVIHPYFSNNLRFIGLRIQNPKQSPNTDGLNPESCSNVLISGIHFSLGDDCVAIKSGKIYMGSKHKVPSDNIVIQHCLMEDGHGAVTVGSEVGAGVNNVRIEKCLFKNTDRGLRVKTRRGRGKDSVLDVIVFDDILMDGVMTPFVVNAFYFCDPDGKTNYVQTKECLPVDDRIPSIKRLYFRNITCKNCHVAASFFYGLPEKKIHYIEMKNIAISFAKDAKSGVPAMLEGVSQCSRKGFYFNNVETLICKNVTVEGNVGDPFEIQNVDQYEKEE